MGHGYVLAEDGSASTPRIHNRIKQAGRNLHEHHRVLRRERRQRPPACGKSVEELGAWIGSSGNALVYGGSKSGLMGAIADSVLQAGGEVTGIEPQFFIANELQHDGLTQLIVTKDMSERKAKMIELGDAFVAFPGGTGTLEEIAEVMSKVSLKHLDAPCILYNLDGYYDDLKALLAKMIDKGLSSKERQEGIYFAESLDEIKQILNEE